MNLCTPRSSIWATTTRCLAGMPCHGEYEQGFHQKKMVRPRTHSDDSELIQKAFTEGFTNYFKWFVKRLFVSIRLALFDDAFVINMMVLIYERSWISSYTMRIMLNFKTWAIVLAVLWCTQVVLLFMTSKCSIEVDPWFESCIEHVFYKLVMPMLTNIFGAKRCSLQPRSVFQPTPCTAFF